MKAAVLHELGKAPRFEDFAAPTAGKDEAVVRVRAASLKSVDKQLASGSHYAGLRSANTYDFTNAYCYVEVVQGPSASTSADAMFTIGRDVNGYYRIFVESGSLVLQKRIGASKVTLLTTSYSPSTDRYWRRPSLSWSIA